MELAVRTISCNGMRIYARQGLQTCGLQGIEHCAWMVRLHKLGDSIIGKDNFGAV